MLGFRVKMLDLGFTQRPQSRSFLGLPYRILNINPQKELLWGHWVGVMNVFVGFGLRWRDPWR